MVLTNLKGPRHPKLQVVGLPHHNGHVKIVTHESSPGFSIPILFAMVYAIMKQKMFALTAPSVW
jgi:hypothetical protein